MARSVFFVLSVFLVLASVSTNAAWADLISWYRFDEGSGTTTTDSSGRGNNGTLMGDTKWVAGKSGGALEFNGSNAYVQTQRLIQDSFTITAWIKTSTSGAAGSQAYQGSGLFWSDVGGAANDLVVAVLGTKLSFFCGNPDTSVNSNGDIVTGKWVHIASVRDTAARTISVFVDGAFDNRVRYTNTGPLDANPVLNIGANTLDGRYYNGVLDDVRMFDTALTETEIAALMRGQPGLSDSRSPRDGATDIPHDAILAWKSGQFDTTHDVYLGTVFDDVNTANRTDPKGMLVSQGQDGTTFHLAGPLDFGQTYYWRVDEVNAAPDSFIHKGDVWTFTTETYGYYVKPIKATASSYSNALAQPDKTIDGSGLNALDQHSISSTQMWLSKKSQTPVWIQYEFDAVYSLHEMWVWNQNQMSEPDNGYGAKDVTIEVSTDGTTWTALEGVPEFAPAPGEPHYVHNTTVDFHGASARFVRLNILSNWGDAKNSGLSEVRFFYVPLKAHEPTPADAATDVAIHSTLDWRPGHEAALHEVYLGTDPKALDLVKTVTQSSLDLGSLGPEYGTTYYWKVNEIKDDAQGWEGDVWSFSTAEYFTVDDFEAYNDTCNRIYLAWEDGFGYSGSVYCGVSMSNGNGTGSMVGNLNPPFAEQTIVLRGSQSMPLAYDNTTGKGYSEAIRTLDPSQDWTVGGIKTLVLHFYGASDNGADQLYVKINGTRVDYTGNAAAITTAAWNQWNVDLTPESGLQAVDTLTLGVSGTGKGILYIDDIRVSRP